MNRRKNKQHNRYHEVNRLKLSRRRRMESWKRREIRKGRGDRSVGRYVEVDVVPMWKQMMDYAIQDARTSMQLLGIDDTQVAERVLGKLGYVSFKGLMNEPDMRLYEPTPWLEFAESIETGMKDVSERARKYWDLANPSVGDGS